MYNFTSLIQALSEYTGLPLEVNEKTSVYLEYNEFILTLQYRPTNNDIVLFTPVTDPDKIANLNETILRNALRLSYNGEGTNGYFLGIFKESLIMSTVMSIKDLTAEDLATQLVRFANTAVSVSNNLITGSLTYSEPVSSSIGSNSASTPQNGLFA